LLLESQPGIVTVSTAALRRPRLRRKIVLSVLGTLAATGLLVFVLAGKRAEFVASLNSAPLDMLGLAAVLQVIALVSRSEAWLVCIHSAGGTVKRRLLFRAAGLGYLASVINGSVGMAARITTLRRVAPDSSPRVPVLLAAEVPIITVEVALVAIFSFTLVAPLGVPWWAPVIAIAVMAGVICGMRRLCERRQLGLWAGLAVMRKKGRVRMITFTLLAVCAQVLRNWLMLHAIGENVSIFDAMALLIAMFTLGQLPIGPSIGPAAAVLVLGAHGVAASAAAGVLLAVTGIVGALCYATWALTDGLVTSRLSASATPPVVAPAPSG
jgi:uncharacterized membrane protein YbhN (UPF0104 family)